MGSLNLADILNGVMGLQLNRGSGVTETGWHTERGQRVKLDRGSEVTETWGHHEQLKSRSQTMQRKLVE